ncbi:MAG: glycosyltransferase, partial [Candidatus Omnitrophica bacterium]|nr:glycosyltransferase [Candidatus Omnitrophota bacterium]
GRLSYEKGLDTLLKCAAAVVKIIPEARFVIAGRGPEEENLKSYTRQLGIEQNVIFLGHRSDAKNIYNSIDVFVNPSLTEGIANTILEAQAMEKPVITTDVGGSGEIITHNANGFLVQPGDVADITEKIMYLLKNKDVAEKIGRQGRKVMYEKFSFKDRLRKIEDLYVELTKRR